MLKVINKDIRIEHVIAGWVNVAELRNYFVTMSLLILVVSSIL